MKGHRLAVIGLVRPTATCTCGWVSEWHRSRGEARRAWDGHVWLADRRRLRAVYGIDAHRKDLPADEGNSG